MLLALKGKAAYVPQSDKQEGRINCHPHSNSKLVETAKSVARKL